MFHRPFLFITFILLPFSSAAQLNTDSLKNSLTEAASDSNKVKTLNRLAWNLRATDPAAAMLYAGEAEKLALQIHFDKGRGDALNCMGVLHYRRGEYPEAAKIHFQALTIRQNIGDKEGMALSYINLGNVHSDQLQNNIAIDDYLHAAQVLEEIHNTSRLSFVYLNIGAVFLSENKFAEAIPYCEKAKAAARLTADKTVEAEAENNLGVAYEGLNRFDDALKKYETSYALSKELDDKTEMSDNMTNIGNMYRQKKDLTNAVDWHLRSEKLCREISYLEGLRVLYEDLSKDYEAKGDFENALKYHIHFKQLSDSLFSDENREKINSLTDKWETDRNEKELLLSREKLRSDAENGRADEQRMWIMAAGGIVILVFLAYAFYAGSRMKRARLLIEAQNDELRRLRN